VVQNPFPTPLTWLLSHTERPGKKEKREREKKKEVKKQKIILHTPSKISPSKYLA